LVYFWFTVGLVVNPLPTAICWHQPCGSAAG